VKLWGQKKVMVIWEEIQSVNPKEELAIGNSNLFRLLALLITNNQQGGQIQYSEIQV
jgi:hypothetical protein